MMNLKVKMIQVLMKIIIFPSPKEKFMLSLVNPPYKVYVNGWKGADSKNGFVYEMGFLNICRLLFTLTNI